jgi:putative ABC transport system ATP-binding protein
MGFRYWMRPVAEYQSWAFGSEIESRYAFPAAGHGGSVAELMGSAPQALPLLDIKDLTRAVGGRRLVDHISLQIPRGEALAIVGPSGSGKSSFLRLLNRLDESTDGKVLVVGVDYHQIAPRELRRRLGLVSQVPALFPGRVVDNLRFGPWQHGLALDAGIMTRLLQEVGPGVHIGGPTHSAASVPKRVAR